MSKYGSFAGRGVDALSKTGMGLAKPSCYAVDGTGRDSYIALNNGGLYSPYTPSQAPDIGTFGNRRVKRDSLATINAKHSNYTSNGTGRDLYIAYAH